MKKGVQEIIVGAAAGQQAEAYLTVLKFPQRFNRLIQKPKKNCLQDILKKCIHALMHSEPACGHALETQHPQAHACEADKR